MTEEIDFISDGAPTVIVVGFTLAMRNALEKFMPDNSVVWVEEPDVARKREHLSKIGMPYIRGLITYEYQLAAAADRFYHRYRAMNVIAVVPGMEYAVPFAARLAERFGTPGASLGAADILRDKSKLRLVAGEAGITNPRSKEIGGPDEARAFMLEHGGSIVLKPANRQAAVGTFIVHDPAEVEGAWAQAIEHDEGPFVPDRMFPLRMLVEQYVHGEEFSVEMLVRDGEQAFGNVTGKVLYPGPRPVELGHTVPAPIPADLTARLLAETERVADAVGFVDGFLHCEWIVSDGTPYLVECAGRMPGDGIIELIENCYPVDIVRAYYDVLMGLPISVELPTTARHGGAVWFLHVEPGEVISVEGQDEAKAVPGIMTCDVVVHAGDRTNELRSSWDRIAIASAKADTVAEALERVQESINRITVKVAPVDDAAPVEAVG
jgi:biotin carboxylase